MQRIQSSERIVAKIKAVHKETLEKGKGKLIDIRSLTFAYESNPDTLIFKDLDFTVNSGDKIVIMGRSGAGKTTLYKLLTSAYPQVIDLI
jgi:ABC-type multidrug transport system fused ATPase/permease subunit